MTRGRLKLLVFSVAVLGAVSLLGTSKAATTLAAAAGDITIRIEAVVDNVNDRGGYFVDGQGNPLFAFGDTIVATATYNRGATLLNSGTNSAGGSFARYRHWDSPYLIEVSINGYRFRSNPEGAYLDAQVNNDFPGDSFWLSLQSYGYQDTFALFDVTAPLLCGGVGSSVGKMLSVSFIDDTGGVLGDTTLPDAPEVPGVWPVGRVSLSTWPVGYGNSPCQDVLTSPSGTIGGRITLAELVPESIGVLIDIKPDSFENTINLGSAGVIPVAILGGATFDVSTVNPESLRLAGARVGLAGKSGRFMCSTKDANEDGYLDLFCHFETENLALQPGDAVAVLTGETYGGLPIVGQDMVRIVPG